jgi:hypothetical protein
MRDTASGRRRQRDPAPRPRASPAARERARRWLERLLTQGDGVRRAAGENENNQQVRKH